MRWRVAFLGFALAGLSACYPALPPARVELPSGPESAIDFGLWRSALFKPAGEGPFPAVVLSHTCGGIAAHIFEWAERLVGEGYVALALDHHGPRGIRMNCGVWAVSVDDFVADLFAAREHLRRLPFVDGERIGAMGFSFGAMAALRVASASQIGRHPTASGGFAASVSLYPYCNHPMPRANQQFNLYDDIATPLLILIGDRDDDTPAEYCYRARELAALGRPVTLSVLPGARHAFDNTQFLNARLVRGRFIYEYSREATEESWRQSRAFFARYLKRG